MIRVPDGPSGRFPDARRARVGTGRLRLAPRRDHQDSLALLQRDSGLRCIRALGLGLMPAQPAPGARTVFRWRGTVTPPSDHEERAAPVRAAPARLVDRHGLDEVRTRPVEVRNEPGLPDFWQNADETASPRLPEIGPVRDESPPRGDERRLPGGEPR
ncbi:hypothetical protein GCM10010129_65210 [Streptomyces fumigatiscleroticus]|nr:hypothetical protein GCM10010129_65210 [Streptomyces fumigatiscleroticus]